MYLRKSKRQLSSRWTDFDTQKFYDAVRVFGRNCDLIHHVVFSPEAAMQRYKDPHEDFSERSIVQIRSKMKKDQAIIDELLRFKDPSHTAAWFEKKYNICITKTLTKGDPDSESSSLSSDSESEPKDSYGSD